MEEYKKETEEGLERPQRETTEEGRRKRRGISNGWLRQQLWLILLICLFGLLLVGNRYRVEGLLRKEEAVKKEIVTLREEGIQRQKEYQESVRISRIANELDSVGVKFISGPPYEIK